MNAQQYRALRKSFLQLAWDSGREMHRYEKGSRSWALNRAYRHAFRMAADRMANHYPLVLESGTETYLETCTRARNRAKRRLRAEIERVTA